LELTCCIWNLPVVLGTYLLYLEPTCSTWNLPVALGTYLLYLDGGKAIRKVFSESNITVAYTSNFNRNPSDDYFRNTLYKISFEGRSTFQPFSCHIVIFPKQFNFDVQRLLKMAKSSNVIL